MINLGNLALVREPEFFQVLRVSEIATVDLGLGNGSLGPLLFWLEFAEGELADPLCEPIGVFGDGKGGRQYIWRDDFWGEADMKLLDCASEQVRADINQTAPGATVRCLLYRLYRGEGCWNGGWT